MRKFKVTVAGQTYEVTVEEITAATPGATATPSTAAAPGSAATETPPVSARPGTRLASSGAPRTEVPETGEAAAGGYKVAAPMPGSVIEVRVKTGDSVAEGDVLIILEAMKMENEITAPVGGTVGSIPVKAGDTVNTGDPLLFIT